MNPAVNEESKPAPRTLHALPPEHLALLVKALAEPGATRASVAERVGLSRTAVSLLLDGKYPASTARVEQKIFAALGRVQCPHLAVEISSAECAIYHGVDAPTSSPLAMRHWRACQECPHNRSKRS